MNRNHFRYRKIYNNLISLFRALPNSYVVARFKPLMPRVMVFIVTYRCNSRCIMCNIWKKGKAEELKPDEIEKLFSNRLFRSIEHVNITGGEPTLRVDLPEIVKSMHCHMPRLRKITIPTNGLSAESVKLLEKVISFCNDKGIEITVRISIDGIGAVHDRIRDVKGAYKKAVSLIETLERLRGKYRFNMGINSVVSKENIHDLQNVRDFADAKGLDISFVYPCFTETFFDNSLLEEGVSIEGSEKEILAGFLRSEIKKLSPFDSNGLYYEQVVRRLEDNAERFMPCPFVNQGIMLDAVGDLYYCQNSKSIGNVKRTAVDSLYLNEQNLTYRQNVKEAICPGCMNSCMVGPGLRMEVFTYIKYLSRRYIKSLRGN